MTEHTPTPWHPVERLDAGVIVLENIDSEEACEIPVAEENTFSLDGARANAAFIAKACNAHDELVAALDEMQKLFVEVQENHVGKAWVYGAEKNLRALNALAKAKGA